MPWAAAQTPWPGCGLPLDGSAVAWMRDVFRSEVFTFHLDMEEGQELGSH